MSRILTLGSLFLLWGQVGLGLRRIVFRVTRRHLAPTSSRHACKRSRSSSTLPGILSAKLCCSPMSSRRLYKLDAHVGEKLDQLEVAFADRAVRRRAALLIVLIVGVVPEQLVALEVAGLPEQRHQAHAVERGLCSVRETDDFRERWKQVHADDRRVADAAGFVSPGQYTINGTRVPPS